MPDSTISAIDRVFDLVDRGVDNIDRVLNREKYAEEQPRDRRSKRAEVIEAVSSPRPKAAPRPAPGTALVRKSRFYVVESISSSGMLFVVTDGRGARAECSTRELAAQVLRALEST